MGALLLLLSTGARHGALARVPLELLDRAIAGRLDFGEAYISPGGEVEVRQARLLDAQGRLLVSAERLRARVHLLDLLRRRVSVERARLDGVVVRLAVGGPAGADIAAAFAPKRASPPGRPAPPWSVHLEDVAAGIERFELRPVGPAAGERLTTVGGRVEGRLALDRGKLSIQAKYAGARAERPFTGPVDASAHLTLGRTEAPRIAFHVEGVRGGIAVDGELDPTTGSGSARAELRGLDPSSLSLLLPSGRIVARIDFQGSDLWHPIGRRAVLDVALSPSELEEAHLGPGKLRLQLGPDELRLAELSLQLPGAALEAHGTLDPFSLSATARLAASDLRELRLFAEQMGFGKLPAFSGAATVDVQASGPPMHPALHAVLAARQIALASLTAGDVALALWTSRWASLPIVGYTLGVGRLDAGAVKLAALTASGSWQGRTLAVDAKARAAGEPLAASGRLDFAPDLGGALLQSLRLRIARRAWRAPRPASLSWRTGPAVGGLVLVSGGARLSFDGALPQRGLPFVHLKARRLDLASLPAFALPRERPRGRLDAELSFQEQHGHRLAAAQVDLRGASLARIRGRYAFRARLAYAKGKLIGRAELDEARRRLLRTELSARLPGEQIDRATDAAELVALLLAAPAKAEGTVGPLQLASAERILGLPERLRGRLTGAFRLRGSVRHPRGELRLRSLATAFAGRELGDLTLAVGAGARGTRAEAQLRRPGRRELLRAGLTFARHPEALASRSALLHTPLSGRAALSQLPLDELLSQSKADFAGTLDATAELGGNLAAPALRASLSAKGLRFRGQALGTGHASIDWNGRLAKIDADLAQVSGGVLTARLGLPVRADVGGGSPLAFGGVSELEGKVEANGVDLGFLSALGGAVRSVQGRLDAVVRLAGSNAGPKVRGRVSLSRGALALRGLGSYRDLALTAVVGDQGAQIQSLSLRSGVGTLEGSGRVDLLPSQASIRIALALRAQDFALWSDDQLRAILTAGIDLEGNLGARSGDLTVHAREARLRLPEEGGRALEPLTLDPGIEIHGSEPPPAARPYALTVRVVTADSAKVTGADLEVPVNADLLARIGADVRLAGRVDVGRGTLEVFGRRLDIERAVLDYGPEREAGREPDDPRLGGSAEQKTSSATVYVGVTGTLRQPQFELRSEPPLSREQIATLLATGVLDQSSPTAAAALAPDTVGGTTLAASAAGAFLSGSLKDAIGDVFPLDVVTLDPSHAELGKRIGRLYLGAVENLGVADPRQNQSEIRASYRLGRGLSLDSRIGDAGADSLDLSWEKSW
ncbi:MAG: translocation/assembly module TamB domain-containing protein [Myxococcales bacterium]